MLIIYGGQDDVIDHSETERVYDVWKHPGKTKIIIPDAGHGWHIFDQCTERIIDWLNEATAEAKN